MVVAVGDDEGFVRVEIASTPVWVEELRDGAQVILSEGSEKAIVKAQFIQENLR